MLKKLLAVAVVLAGFAAPQAAVFDGVVFDTSTGDPLPGAIVSVTIGAGHPLLDTTDALGEYYIRTGLIVVPVNYTETYTATGYIPKSYTGTLTSGGQTVSRKVALALAGLGSIDGTVTDSLAATPISGAKARLYQLVDFGGRPRYVALDSVNTNASGLYQFTNLSNLTVYRVTIIAATYNTKSVSGIAIIPGRTTTVNFALSQPAGLVGDVNGRVTDSVTTVSIANAMVVLTNSVTVFTPETTYTNVMGDYGFTGKPIGATYVVTVSKANYYTKAQSGITIPANSAVTVNVALRAYTASVHGVISNRAGGALIADARVALLANSGAVWTRLDSVTTGADGAYQFTPLPADTYRVVVQAPSFYPDSSGDSIVANGQNKTINVTMTAVGRGTLRVKVSIDTAGNPPIAGASIYAVLAPGPVHQDTLTATTDAQGWAVIADAIEGIYRIHAYAAGFIHDSLGANLVANTTDSTTRFTLRRYAGATKTISGIVRVLGSGLPIGGAIVTLQLGLTTFRDTAITSGDYSITFPSSFTTGQLGATADGYLPFDSTVSLAAASTNLNISLEGAVGTVATAPAKAIVSHVAVSARNVLSVSAAKAGTFSLFSLDGKLVYRSSVKAGETVVTLRAGTSRTLVSELKTGSDVVRSKVVLR